MVLKVKTSHGDLTFKDGTPKEEIDAKILQHLENSGLRKVMTYKKSNGEEVKLLNSIKMVDKTKRQEKFRKEESRLDDNWLMEKRKKMGDEAFEAWLELQKEYGRR